MGALDGRLSQVKDAITQHTSDPNAFHASTLLGHVTDLFGKASAERREQPEAG